MNRDKVLEFAKKAGFNWPEISTTTIEERLERFAALIEAEMCKHQADKFCETHCSWTDHHVDCDQVRWDAEPTLYQRRMKHLFDYRFQWSAWEECSKEVFNQHERRQIWGDYVYEARKLYLHPAPSVVRQLVEALEETLPAYKESMNAQGIAGSSVAWNAEAALAAAKEAGL